MQPVSSANFCNFPITSCSCEKKYQALPAFPYCKRWKAGRGLGTRLGVGNMLLRFPYVVFSCRLDPTFNDTTTLSHHPYILCHFVSYAHHKTLYMHLAYSYALNEQGNQLCLLLHIKDDPYLPCSAAVNSTYHTDPTLFMHCTVSAYSQDRPCSV